MNSKMQELLKKARKQSGLNQQEVADKMTENGVKITDGTISNWENGKSDPAIDDVYLLCKIYNTNFVDLMNESYGNPVPQRQNIECDIDEINLIKKFRELDYDGKEFILLVVEREFRRRKNKFSS